MKAYALVPELEGRVARMAKLADRPDLGFRNRQFQNTSFRFKKRSIGVSIYDPMVSFFVRHRQFLLVRVDHEHGQQLSGFGLARVLTNAVPVTRHLGEALPGAIRNDRPIIDRTSDGSLENGRIDESRLWMRVGRRRVGGPNHDHDISWFIYYNGRGDGRIKYAFLCDSCNRDRWLRRCDFARALVVKKLAKPASDVCERFIPLGHAVTARAPDGRT